MTQPAILLVDAEILVREPLAHYLRECGYLVMEATGIEEATQLLEQSDVRPQAMLVSVSTSGAELTFVHWARETFPHLQILLAGSVSAKAERAGRLCEAGPPLRKPYDHQLVEERIRRNLATQTQES